MWITFINVSLLKNSIYPDSVLYVNKKYISWWDTTLDFTGFFPTPNNFQWPFWSVPSPDFVLNLNICAYRITGFSFLLFTKLSCKFTSKVAFHWRVSMINISNMITNSSFQTKSGQNFVTVDSVFLFFNFAFERSTYWCKQKSSSIPFSL